MLHKFLTRSQLIQPYINLLLLQIINKSLDYNRKKILKEIDIFTHCQGHENILQLNEFYEEDENFYLVFDRLKGGV